MGAAASLAQVFFPRIAQELTGEALAHSRDRLGYALEQKLALVLEGGRWGPQELAAAGRAMLQFRSILFAPNAPVGICHGVKQAVMQICF